ncbi:CHAT domain-containing tetratricopeptide repeat protein [Micromonospora lupini]|uniref:CHAT domain-containing tetratricopeptide repeat protein n=1 Tax=Micromonospora lupini TaxID=285679 RepID=UPI0031CDD944
MVDNRPRAYLLQQQDEVGAGRKGLLAALILAQIAVLAFLVSAMLGRNPPSILQLLILLVLAQLFRALNDKIYLPTLATRGDAAVLRVYAGAFRPLLTCTIWVALAVLTWLQFGAQVAVVGGLVLVGIGLRTLINLRRATGGLLRWRDIQLMNSLLAFVSQADVEARRGELAAARELQDRAANHPAVRKHPKVLHTIAMQRAAWALVQGDHALAERQFKDAAEYLRKHTDRSALGEALTGLGNLYLAQERYAEARAVMTEALRVAGGKMYRLNRVRIEYNLAVICVQTDDTEAALSHALEARTLSRQWGAFTVLGNACDVLAGVAAEAGRPDEADAYLAEAAEAYRQDDAGPNSWTRHHLMRAIVFTVRGDEVHALDAYLLMIRLLSEVRAGWGWRDAQAHLTRVMGEQELTAVRLAHARYDRGDDSAVDFLTEVMDLSSRTALRQVLRGGIATDDRADDLQPDLVRLLGEIASYEDAISGQQSAQPGADQPDDRERKGLVSLAAYERLESLVSIRFRRMFQGTAPPASGAPAGRVPPGSHLLQARLFDDDGSVVITGIWTSPDGVRVPYLHTATDRQASIIRDFIVPAPRRAAGDGVEGGAGESVDGAAGALPTTFRAQNGEWGTSRHFRRLRTPKWGQWSELAALLLPAGLLTLLSRSDPDGDVPHLLIVPDPVLWRVPWAVLAVRNDGADRFLADHAILSYLPSLALLDDTAPDVEQQSHGPAAAYLADVDADGIRIEKEALTSAYGDTVEFLPTPEALLSVLRDCGTRSPLRLLAVSVHGNGSPGLAHALALTDGTELSAARMLALRFPPLLLINACLSAELDQRQGTDPLGIPTVALCRGAETVLGGLFPLPDGTAANPEYSHATATIVSHLYGLLSAGVPPSIALRRAQRRWRESRPEAPPVLWAGLVALGVDSRVPAGTSGGS